MTEEEYFRKNYPDSCYGDRPLSPYWDFFEEGVEFGERQSEKKIAELEKENVELKGLRCCENCKNVNLQLHWRENEEIDKRRQFVCGTCGNRKHWEYLGKTVGITETQQLTIAKDLIHQFLIQNPISDWLPKKAEQFLKEIEK